MTSRRMPYWSYLLRRWTTSGDGYVVWRASLENPHTGERLGFSSLEQLFLFLEDQTTEIATSEDSPN